MRGLITAFTICMASCTQAEALDLEAIIEGHVLPGYRQLGAAAGELASVAATDCNPANASLRGAFHKAFDSWVSVSHLRFGPSEVDDRAYALAFWPDPRGSTPKSLGRLLRTEDEVVERQETFRTVSVAARGFYALEFLLFDPQFTGTENPRYRCALIRAITVDIADNANAILDGWVNGYADLMVHPGNDTYRSEAEVARQLFTALSTGLEFTSEIRLGRPVGTFDRPRPNRAEARRSGRSLRHVVLSLEACRDLADRISGGKQPLDASFARAADRAGDLNDPVFAEVSNPQGRLHVEILQQAINTIRQQLDRDVGPRLGIAAGFNALDGDLCQIAGRSLRACLPPVFARERSGQRRGVQPFCLQG